MTGVSEPPMATGGMSPDGTTTQVVISRAKVKSPDKQVLCSAICKCKEQPNTSVDGRSLKQICVSGRLRALDGVMQHRSPYKPEVNYDMTKEPPAPIMDSAVGTKGHDWLPGWIKKWWDVPDSAGGQRPPFRPGRGMVRRPDVVIVSDPTKPPTQDNIKQVVEIKFPPDKHDQQQFAAYTQIAGDESKVVVMGPDDCNCDDPDSGTPNLSPEAIAAAAGVAAAIYSAITRRPPPGLKPAF